MTRLRNGWPVGVVKRRAKLNDGERWYIYAWRGGPQLAMFDRLPERCPPSLLRAYEDLRAAQSMPASDTLMGLIRKYKESPAYRALAPESLRWTNRHLKGIEAEFGDVTFAMAEHKEFIRDIEEWRDRMAATPATADAHVRMLKTLLKWGVERAYLACNRAVSVESIHPEPDYADQVWTVDEIARFREAAPAHLRHAFDLARLTGLRQADVVRLTWAAIKGDLIEWATSKSRGRRIAHVPITPELRAVLEEIPRKAVVILTGAWGRPMRASRLREEFAEVRVKAGVTKRWHDLRGNAATALMTARPKDGPLSDREISVLLGVSERNVAKWRKRYVADRAIAQNAAARLFDLSEHRQKTDKGAAK